MDAARTHGEGAIATVALQATTCEVPAGARVGIVGPSGSGKSTLFHLMAGLDEPTVGTVDWPRRRRQALRPGPVAVVFQARPAAAPDRRRERRAAAHARGRARREARAGARARRSRGSGLAELTDRLPEEISGGQAQRVAVARALAGEPAADPRRRADRPARPRQRRPRSSTCCCSAAEHAGAALVVATHDPAVADRLGERWEMHSGRLATAEAAAWSR